MALKNQRIKKYGCTAIPIIRRMLCITLVCSLTWANGNALAEGIETGAVSSAATSNPALSDGSVANQSDSFSDIETENVTDKAETLTTPFIVYLSGVDTRDKTLQTSNSDVNILGVVNPVTKNALLVNTPRDYYVENPAGSNAMDKLTHCGVYGIENSEKALEQLYGCSVDYYMQFNFTGFVDLIDTLGGITVYSDEEFDTGEYHFVQGYNDMDGEQALAFARDRYDVAYGDNGRGRDQMRVIEAVVDKITSDPTPVSESLPKIMEGLGTTFNTDFSILLAANMLSGQAEDMSEWNVKHYAVTGHNGQDYTYSMPDSKNDVMYQDPDLVAHASDIIQKCLDGVEMTDDVVGETVEMW